MRPNASWAGPPKEGIAPPGHLTLPHGGVGMPRPLPPQLGFGSLTPGITTGSRFSGGASPTAMNLVHPEPPPTFQAPIYNAPSVAAPAPSRAIAPIIAALMATGVGAPVARGGGVGPAPPPPAPGVRSALAPGYPNSAQVSQGAANAATYPSGDLGIQSSFITNPFQSSSQIARRTSPSGSNYIKSQ